MSQLLLNEKPLMVLPKLATLIGLNEAIFIQQVHFWIQHTNNVRDGEKWVYNTYEEWQKNFPFWSVSTIRRTISKLENQKLLITANYNKMKQDNTRWFRVDYKQLEIVNRQSEQNNPTNPVNTPSGQNDQFESMNTPPVQNEQTQVSEWTDPLFNMSRAIPEITTENKDSIITNTVFEDPKHAKTPEQGILKDFETVEDPYFLKVKKAVSEMIKDHKLSEKYLLTDLALLTSIFQLRKQEESEANDTSFKGLKEKESKIPFQGILQQTTVMPVPEFSIYKRTDKTSFLKILFGYIKRYNRFPTEDEMKWIQDARKGAKKPFTPSEVEQGMDLQIKDGSNDGFVDNFTTYLWNARQNYAQPKKKQSTAVANDIPVISNFDDFD